MVSRVPVEGLKELDRALGELTVATRKNVARKVLKMGGKPIIEDFKARAPRLTGRLGDDADVSTKLSKRQARLARKSRRDTEVTVYAGAGPDPAAVAQEFGNVNHPAQPSLTPAFEGNKRTALGKITKGLKIEIDKAANRARRKAAKFK